MQAENAGRERWEPLTRTMQAEKHRKGKRQLQAEERR
jgi:hypothetical protein